MDLVMTPGGGPGGGSPDRGASGTKGVNWRRKRRWRCVTLRLPSTRTLYVW